MATAKILVVGNYQSGKTTLCYDVMEELGNKVTRPAWYTATKGVEVKYVIDDLQVVKLLDCAGHPDYRGFTEIYYESADAVVVVGPPGDWAEQVRDVAGYIPVVHTGTEPNLADLGQIVSLWRE